MEANKGKNIVIRLDNYLINFDRVVFIKHDRENNCIYISYDNGFTDTISDSSKVKALLQYVKMYPDLEEPKTIETMAKFASSLKNRIKTDIAEDK